MGKLTDEDVANSLWGIPGAEIAISEGELLALRTNTPLTLARKLLYSCQGQVPAAPSPAPFAFGAQFIEEAASEKLKAQDGEEEEEEEDDDDDEAEETGASQRRVN